jgi:hypothetical protein
VARECGLMAMTQALGAVVSDGVRAVVNPGLILTDRMTDLLR